jgi:hypothetical protein
VNAEGSHANGAGLVTPPRATGRSGRSPIRPGSTPRLASPSLLGILDTRTDVYLQASAANAKHYSSGECATFSAIDPSTNTIVQTVDIAVGNLS